MDRLSHLRGEAGGSRDSTLDSTSPPSESYMTANESSSKYFSLSEVDTVDSSFDISSIKDVSLAATVADPDGTMTNADELISKLSPIGKKSDMLDSYKIGKQIEAANILSGGVDIFDDNDNSYDGDELVIDDNVEVDDKSNSEMKQPEEMEFKSDENIVESTLINEVTDIASKDSEVMLQIDGKHVDAIDIGNGLYLYRQHQDELAAIQIIEDEEQESSIKFLKVRDNEEGNLEIYEEIQIEVPKEVPAKEGKVGDKKMSSHVPIKDINKVISESACNKVAEKKIKTPRKEPILATKITKVELDGNKEISSDAKSEVNINGKMMKFSESRKSPVIGSFTPMTYHSTPNKERIPLTKTMVDQQLHPSRHSDNVKKTIEVHTDSCKQRTSETPTKNKGNNDNKTSETVSPEKGIDVDEPVERVTVAEESEKSGKKTTEVINIENDKTIQLEPSNDGGLTDKLNPNDTSVTIEQENIVDSSEKETKLQTTETTQTTENTTLNEKIESEIVNEEKSKEKKETVINIEDNMEDVEIIDTVTEPVADKNKANIKELFKSESDNLVRSENNVIQTSHAEFKISEPIQAINENVEIDLINEQEDKIDTSNEEGKEIVKGNTQCDSQDVTQDEEIIYDITTDLENDEIIIIDDSELDETKIEVTTSATDEDHTKQKDMKSNDQENEKTYIATENEDETKIKENVKDIKKDSKNIEVDSTSAVILDTQKEKTKKDEPAPSSEIVKNIHSKIPIVKPEGKKEIIKLPTGTKETPVTKPLISVVVEGKVELTPESSEEKGTIVKAIAKEIFLDKVLSTSHSTPEECSKAPVKIDKKYKNQENSEIVSETLVNTTPIHIPLPNPKTETAIYKKENNVVKKSPKKESKKSIPIAESQSNVKAEASGKCPVSSGNVPSVVKAKKHKDASQLSSELKTRTVAKEDVSQETKTPPKENVTEELNTVKDVKVSNVPKEEQPSCSGTQDVSSTSTDNLPTNESRIEGEDDTNAEEPQPGGSKKAVPFGKWTATNRKEFLNKIKNRNTVVTPAVPSTSTNQLKNSNDLNRRDVLQKIDSQRQQSSSAAALAKTQDGNKVIKNETAFVSKANMHKDNNTQESKIPLKVETVQQTSEAEAETAVAKLDVTNDISKVEVQQATTVTSLKKEAQITEVNYQDLIDKTIEDMIHRTVGPPKAGQDEPNQTSGKDSNPPPTGKFPANYQPTDQATLDEIEMKMNELHGIPFIERPPHELPVVPLSEPKSKTFSKSEKEKPLVPIKTTKIPNLLPFSNKSQHKIIKDNVIEVDSEDEIIEHEPITGDINLNKKIVAAKLPTKEKVLTYVNSDKCNSDTDKKDPIITEKDFDKFARRNSITYENCLTVSFDNKEPHNVIKTVVEKDPYPKTYSRNDAARVDKPKLPVKYQNLRQPIQPAKVHTTNKSVTDDSSNRNQSKLQKAYQSALSAKRQKECPITIIEDRPVKVVFMDNMEFVQSPLNIQGQQLSPAKKPITDPDSFTLSTLDSLDSGVVDVTDDSKSQEEVKTKSKHQRKQVLTPVDEPELELIEPKDLGLEVSPKKKRKTEEDKTDKNVKYPMRKKYYLLGSNTAAEDKYTHTSEVNKNPLKETVNLNDNGVAHKNTVSAIDSLVKAAELLEHSENMNIIDSPTPDSQQSTPVKRGRGRPRKYPLPEGGVEKNKVPSPQKKPRLIDAKVPKRDTMTTTDEEDDDDVDSEGQIIKENWTMGKINENIVCPICNKLFRTENVVFKHVKHCTGPSPSRSGSDKRSSRSMRPSQESDSKSQGSKSDDMDIDDDKPLVVRKETPKKRKSKDSVSKSDDIIVIEDTPPAKERTEKKEKEIDERKIHESRNPKAKIFPKSNDLVCEFCGKTFRQLSYLVSHKLQHKKDEPKKIEKEASVVNKSVYSCEVCKKEFRKLHHLVQHRIIHNPSSAPARSLRKSSSEQSDNKIEKEPTSSKLSEDPSAGFRCEPCDKSFRKLHHLVEHRETHDGINRQKITPAVPNNVEKPVSLHQCEICKKTFKKLHHLIEHKEQHVETSSEKSDDKSVKSSLSTRDIIHECSLCYMVFPNEHSLNKHTIICQRKKRQSKQAKATEESESTELTVESAEIKDASSNVEEKIDDTDSPKLVIEEKIEEEHNNEVVEKIELPKEPISAQEKPEEVVKEVEKEVETIPEELEIKPVESPVVPVKRDFVETEVVAIDVKPEVPEKIKKFEIKETIKMVETPKKKTSIKEKSSASVNKRLKTTGPVPIPEPKPAAESSDDDEVRYMLNPNFKVEEPAEEKVFMKVRANKRSSLQIERPNSKDLVKRRTSLQHPPKIPRLKPKAVEPHPAAAKHIAKAPKLEPVPSTDSDDSDTVKYSFPKTIPDKTTKPAQDRTPNAIERKTQKKTLADKRKSLSGIAKRKSLGKAVTAKHKPSPMKQVKRRTLEVEHRCDCGQLFSSAALLSRHTTLAHTPPRIRRQRDPPPDNKPAIKLPRKSSVTDKPTNTRPNKSETKPTRKSLDKETKTPAAARKPKPEKSEAKSSVKPKRTPAHRGVPVPEKMRKLMQKNNK